ncbi:MULTISPECIES: helix-turn-helix domain-containing protein [Pseudomonas]|uniref:helix-turn-helix domain-containing protein n=1 Tax=Pseudomonas TaxID=286 RepID=UPI002AB4AA71|nr:MULTISPECIES: XRE family transcriptional regulator [unclassified Pseudomonas]MDY7581210.1 XRE family transcriptional regulator [Pseudomonas sp. CCI3.1]MEB0068493.1 XRE family transcriptional regulator [Pseudomonas sp. CCI3.1]MEB0073031.1 XRE family transcriptional regulator [Pseudomonas sp. CCI1.4]
MDIGQSIRKARKAKGLTLEALANQVDTDTGNLSRLERGLQGASQELLKKIMAALDMTIGHSQPLDDGHSNVQVALQPNRAPKEYPLISWVIAGSWAESPENFQPGDADEWISSTENAGDHGFWLDVKGDSMTCFGNPSFPEGSRILIRPESDLVSGKYYVVRLLDSGEQTFKQYVEDAGHKYLRPLNPSYRTIEINGNCHFIGRVVDAKMTGL